MCTTQSPHPAVLRSTPYDNSSHAPTPSSSRFPSPRVHAAADATRSGGNTNSRMFAEASREVSSSVITSTSHNVLGRVRERNLAAVLTARLAKALGLLKHGRVWNRNRASR